MTLAELKAKATEIGLTPDEVRQHGSLSKKATWETAIAEFKQWEEAVNVHCEQMDIPQWTHPEDEPEAVEDIAVTVNQTVTPEASEIAPGNDSVQNQFPPSNPIPPIQPDETIEVEGWHRWDEKLKVWIQEDPNQALKDCYQPESDSLRDQLLKRMQPYVGNCITQQDFEQLQNEPLDEPTAAVYLGLLDGSEKVLAGAVT